MCGENKCELCKAGKVGIGVARLARARLDAQPGAVWSRARSKRSRGLDDRTKSTLVDGLLLGHVFICCWAVMPNMGSCET